MLQPGNYAMVCFVPGPDGIPHIAKGMARPLTVTAGAGATAAEPEADVVMKLVDYDFELSKPIPAGRHTIRIDNAGPQEHEVVIVKLDAGKEPMTSPIGARRWSASRPARCTGASAASCRAARRSWR